MKLPYLLTSCGLALSVVLSVAQVSFAQNAEQPLTGQTEVSDTCYAYDQPLNPCNAPNLFERYANDYWDKRNQQGVVFDFDRTDPLRRQRSDVPAWGYSPYPFVQGPISMKEERIREKNSYKVITVEPWDRNNRTNGVDEAVDATTPVKVDVEEEAAQAMEQTPSKVADETPQALTQSPNQLKKDTASESPEQGPSDDEE